MIPFDIYDIEHILKNNNNINFGAFDIDTEPGTSQVLTLLNNIDEFDFRIPVVRTVPENKDGYGIDVKEYKRRYDLSEKHVNKLKRSNPNQKIIDAYDIDWTGFMINIGGNEYRPKTTFEVLDIIFRMLKYLYGINGSEYVVWNDAGERRTDDNRLNWFNTDKSENPDKNDLIDNNKINAATVHSWLNNTDEDNQ